MRNLRGNDSSSIHPPESLLNGYYSWYRESLCQLNSKDRRSLMEYCLQRSNVWPIDNQSPVHPTHIATVVTIDRLHGSPSDSRHPDVADVRLHVITIVMKEPGKHRISLTNHHYSVSPNTTTNHNQDMVVCGSSNDNIPDASLTVSPRSELPVPSWQQNWTPKSPLTWGQRRRRQWNWRQQ